MGTGICVTRNEESWCNTYDLYQRMRLPYGQYISYRTIRQIREKLGRHDDEHHGEWRHVGNCDKKKKGETCKVVQECHCIPSSKCPVFKNELVCYPSNAHP